MSVGARTLRLLAPTILLFLRIPGAHVSREIVEVMSVFGRSLFVTVTMLISLQSVEAREIYRTVGPDGKVTFSDSPPANSNTSDKYSVQSAPEASSPTTPAKEVRVDAPASSSAARHMTAKQAIRSTPSQTESTATNSQTKAAPPIDPALEKAIIGVLGYDDLVRQTEDLCVRTLPTSMQKYSGAADGWRQRNGALVARAKQTLATQFDSVQKQSIEAGIRTRNTNSLAPVTNAATSPRINWCDRSSDEMKSGNMDVYNKPHLSQPITNAGG